MAEKKIGKRTFSVGSVLATDAIRLQVRLLRIIGGGVDRLPVILAGAGSNVDPKAKEASNAAAVAAIADMISKADPDEVVQLFNDIGAMAMVRQPSGSMSAVDIDSDFTEHKGELLPFITWVLKEVLGDFFGGLQAAGALSKMMGQD